MSRKFLLIACFSGAGCVMLGAFGAHLLKNTLSEQQLQIFETGVQYQFYHTFALLAVAILSRYLSHRWLGIAGWLFVAGIVLFSGSLYVLALADAWEMQHLRPALGPMTPFGGLLFIAGWLALFRAGMDYKKKE
jgi:uncharacterized membrane protein YgdD (TMEM256/DUF423 family)